MQLGVTYRCNFKCVHCYALYRRSQQEFRFKEIENLLHSLRDLGATSIVYSHGESLVRRDFFDIAAIANQAGFFQTLMTNGSLIKSQSQASKLLASGIDRVLVSLDSADQIVHDTIRGVDGAFQSALAAIDHLKNVGISWIGFSSAIDRHNYGNISDIVTLAIKHKINGISFMQNRYNSPGVFDQSLWNEYKSTCKAIYESMLQYRDQLDIYSHDPFMLHLLDQRLTDPLERAAFIGANQCNVGRSMISIDPCGDVSACNFIDEVIGNVHEESIEKIWNRLVKRYDSRNAASSASTPCSDCVDASFCQGGCKTFHYSGSYDQRCGMQRVWENAPHNIRLDTFNDRAPHNAVKPGAYASGPKRNRIS